MALDWTWWLAGGLFAAGGAYLYCRRSKGLLFLGAARETQQAGGMTLKHYRSGMKIKERVGILQDLAWDSIKDPEMRKLALQITSRCPERDGLCEAKAIYHAMKRRIRYTGDVAPIKMGRNGPVEGVDLFQTAKRTWEFKGGDCDDAAVLAATLLSLNGIPARFRITAPSKGRKADWAHIYTMAGVPKTNPTRWVAIDTTLPGSRNFNREVRYGKKIDFVA